jgi:hypothetical protein
MISTLVILISEMLKISKVVFSNKENRKETLNLQEKHYISE